MSIRWASWRRDLTFAVAGALVALAALVPVWLSQVRAERQRAEAAEQEAATQRTHAEEQARIAREATDFAAARMTDEDLILADLAARGRRANAEYAKLEDEYTPPGGRVLINPPPPIGPGSPLFGRPLLKDLIPDMPAPIPPALP